MLTAFSKIDPICYAWSSEKEEGPFCCKNCKKEVILKKGSIRQHHFAHKPPNTCSSGKGETEVHYKTKRAIFEGLQQNDKCSFCELEYYLGGAFLDIFAIIKGQKVAIEIQKSKMTVAEAYDRTVKYYQNGLSVIWIIPRIEELKIRIDDSDEVCNVAAWKKFFHALFCGRLYIWSQNGIELEAIHFADFERYVEESFFYDECGYEESYGGYYKKLKTIKRIKKYPKKFDLVEDFRAYHRTTFDAGKLSIPACSVWIDNKPKWW